ncbi:hypothetical protein JOD54_006561 [Actinokineospora baliensis]|nr:hypothetical protein [Actinokineospora baliensis]
MALQQRVHGLVGLEIDSAHARVYDENNAGLFLKNLLTLHDFPALAKHVEPAPSDPPRRPPVDTSDMDDYFTGFSNGLFGRGLNQPQCIYAAELAWRGQRLRPGKRVEPDREPEEPTIPVRNIPTEVVRLLKQGNPVELLSAVQLHVRREQLSAVREVVRTAGRLERDIQTALGNAWWMFGGEFAGEAVRRRMVDTIELDIPLLRPDGVLHVVELKRADVLTVRRHRNGLIVASAVHEAVGQVMNYLTLLDEQRGAVFEEFSIDTRRASATIVVGHPDFQDDLTAAEIHETLRIFNSHLSRVEVISYQQLVDRAERVLDLVAKPDGVPTA